MDFALNLIVHIVGNTSDVIQICEGASLMQNNNIDAIDLSNVIHGSDTVRVACSPGDIDDCSPDRGGCLPEYDD